MTVEAWIDRWARARTSDFCYSRLCASGSTTFSQFPMCSAASFPPLSILTFFFRGRGCSVPGSPCSSISNNKSQQRRSAFLRDVKVPPFPQNVLSRKCDNDCEDRRTKKTPVSESVVPVFCASTLGRLPNHQPSCLTDEVIASGADENARPS